MANDDRGFASMDPEKQRKSASKGGKMSSTNFKNRDPEEVQEIASKGGEARAESLREDDDII